MEGLDTSGGAGLFYAAGLWSAFMLAVFAFASIADTIRWFFDRHRVKIRGFWEHSRPEDDSACEGCYGRGIEHDPKGKWWWSWRHHSRCSGTGLSDFPAWSQSAEELERHRERLRVTEYWKLRGVID